MSHKLFTSWEAAEGQWSQVTEPRRTPSGELPQPSASVVHDPQGSYGREMAHTCGGTIAAFTVELPIWYRYNRSKQNSKYSRTLIGENLAPFYFYLSNLSERHSMLTYRCEIAAQKGAPIPPTDRKYLEPCGGGSRQSDWVIVQLG